MSTEKIKVQAPAKINLYLKVLGKRDDGYHNIQTIMQPVSLYDELEFELVPEGIQLSCSQPELAGPDNLVHKAAELLRDRFAPSKGIKIHLDKQIPVAAGLGGGSSDAAAALVTLNDLWELNLTQDQLLQLGVELGADVPFFVKGGVALAEGIGEKLTPWPSLACWVVLVKPNFSVSTAWAYKNLFKEGLTKEQNCINILQLEIAKNNLPAVKDRLFNDFECLVAKKHPLVEEIKTELLAGGSEGTLMSGSGPTVFGLFAGQDIAEVTCNRLKLFMQEKGVVFLVKAIG